MRTTRRNFTSRAAAGLAALAFAKPRISSGLAAAGKAIGVWSAWDIANIGDIAHTPGLLRTIQEFLPGTPIVLFANMLNDHVRRMILARFPGLIIHEGWLWADTPEGAALRGKFSDCALFIRNSNMGSATDYMDHLIERRLPFGVYGQTYPPHFLQNGETAAQHLERLNRASFFYCREKETLGLLQRAGVRCPHLAFVPDGAFGIDVRDEEAASRTMRQLDLEAGKFITIQLRSNTAAHLPGELPPGYDPKWNMKAPNEPLDRKRAAKYLELIEAWVRKTGGKVLIAPEAKKEIVHNRRLLYDPLPESIRANVRNMERFWNADEAASVFARAHAVICHEPHSPIIALANGTPAIHTHSTEHGPKSFMFRDLGLEEWLFEHDRTPASAMIDALFAISRDYAAARVKVHAAMRRVHALREWSMTPIRDLLRKAA